MTFGIQPYFDFLGFSPKRPKIEIEKIPGIHPSHGSIFYHLSLRCHLVPCGTLSVASPSRKILAKQTTESFIFVSSDSDSEDWRIWLWKSEEKKIGGVKNKKDQSAILYSKRLALKSMQLNTYKIGNSNRILIFSGNI